MKNKTAIFIDGDYFYHLSKRFQLKIDFSEFYKLLNQKFGESKIYYYSSTNPKSKNFKSHQSFLSHLFRFGYIVNTSKVIENKSNKTYSSNLDMKIAIDVIDLIDSYSKLVLISGDRDFVPLFKLIKSKGKETILIGMPIITSNELIKESMKFYNLKNFISLKIPKEDFILENEEEASINKEDKLDNNINDNLERINELGKMIAEKKSETDLHSYIKKEKLIPGAIHEFGILKQNRNDFLLKNEFGEFELWELKSPSEKLFDRNESKINDPSRYNKLKGLQKNKKLIEAIEQLSIYKKECIDENREHKEKDERVEEHIYNAKLILVYGSNEEFKKNTELYLEKLNLERYMLNNLTIITWEMFYEKIKSLWGIYKT